jgi:glycogen debranching enzyme
LRGTLVDTTTALASVPLWWRLGDEDKAQMTIDRLVSPEFVSDWGMRLISQTNPMYVPNGYHFGAVWPVFSGWASVGEYTYHRSLSAYLLLRANCLLAHAGASGRVTEVLSGSYFEPLSNSCPHQIWSSAMVVNPILRGLFGLQARIGDRDTHLNTHSLTQELQRHR